MRLTPAQVALLRTGEYSSVYVFALAKPAGDGGMPAAETEATATYKWTSASDPITYNSITYSPDGSPTSVEYPDSAPELNDESSTIVLPYPTFTLRTMFDTVGWLGWKLFWRRLIISSIPTFPIRSYRGLITAYSHEGETRDIIIAATGPFAKYDRKSSVYMSPSDQKSRDENDTSMDQVGDKIEIKVGS